MIGDIGVGPTADRVLQRTLVAVQEVRGGKHGIGEKREQTEEEGVWSGGGGGGGKGDKGRSKGERGSNVCWSTRLGVLPEIELHPLCAMKQWAVKLIIGRVP